MKAWILNNLSWIIPTATTVVLAIINVCFLFGQKKRQNTQICIALMEKRANVYYEIQKVLATVISEGDSCSNGNIRELTYNTREVEMLFGEDIERLIKEIRGTINRLILVSKKVKVGDEPNRSELCDEEFELSEKVSVYRENLFESFRKYLDFSEYMLPKKVNKNDK